MIKIFIFLIAGAAGIVWTSDANKSFKEVMRPFMPPPAHIEHFHFGYREQMADILWIRMLQDFGACKVGNELQDLPGDQISSCHLGWTYRMADAITTLSPDFKIVYDTSALLLSIVGGDAEGSRRIFEKGLARFPNDWSMHYRAGYHYLIEIKDNVRAAELIKRAADLGGPGWLYTLAARLYGREGKLDLARKVLNEYLEANPEGAYAKRARDRLREIEQGLVGDKEVRDGETPPAK